LVTFTLVQKAAPCIS